MVKKKKRRITMKFCINHASLYDEPQCPQCKAGEPKHIRKRSEVIAFPEKDIKELERRGLIED